MRKMILLGVGDSLGVPRVYCSCVVCTEARTTGKNARFRSSVLVESGGHDFIIDCGPDWRRQMERLERRHIGHVLITHAHHDHIAGLPEWADACRWTETPGHVYAPEDITETIHRQYPWLKRQFAFHPISQKQHFFGWELTAWKVNHGKNGYSYAYKFASPRFQWVYCPDSIQLSGDQKAPMFDVDLLVLGTSYYKETFESSSRSVYDMVEACELLKELRPQKVLFTHMSHGVDCGEAYPLPANVRLGEQFSYTILDKNEV